jgi:hypothetical protein
MQIQITRNTFIAGDAFAIGDTADVDKKTARELIAMGKATEAKPVPVKKTAPAKKKA